MFLFFFSSEGSIHGFEERICTYEVQICTSSRGRRHGSKLDCGLKDLGPARVLHRDVFVEGT